MVLCKHFQQGYCRFGSKCNFEHLDIKQLVKSDVEGAINGKQYLFSCYGPFKDKPCIPNFIEDQSFEELRLMCYDAKQKNCFDQFNQLTRQCAADAMNKMKALIQPSYEIVNMLTSIYDAPANSTSVGSTTNTANNPFGLNSTTTTNAGSIFGKSTLAQTTNNNANVFGGTGIFGGGNVTNNTQTAGGIFGGQSAFGATQQQQQQPLQNSIFGQTAPQQQSAVSNSIFGGGVNKTSLFGQQQPDTQNNTGSGFGLFAQASNTQNAPAFGQPPSFGQAQQMQPQQQNTNLFGQNQNLFNNQQANVNPFGQPQNQPQTQNIFTQPASMMRTQQQSGAMFAQAAAQAPQPTSFFQQTGASMPMENMQQPAVLPQTQAAQQTAPTPQNTGSIYSRMEDLTADEIAAFKAEIFEPGKLPFVPPPLELING